MPDWFVAKVKPNNEHKLQTYLQSFGVEVYTPTIVVMKSGKQRLEPLFPGYAFVHTSPRSREWPIVRWAPGLAYFLPNQEDPLSVPAPLIGEIEAKVANWNGGGWIAAFEAGERVRVTSGPLKSLDAVFERYVPGKERCEVLISMLGGLHRVTVPIRSLEHPVATQKFGGLELI